MIFKGLYYVELQLDFGYAQACEQLAPLPTQRSESSELCALGDLFKVRLPLPISGRV